MIINYDLVGVIKIPLVGYLKRVSMGLTVSRKTTENLVVRRKNEKF